MGNLSPIPNLLPIAFRAIDEYMAAGALFSIDGERLDRACAMAASGDAKDWNAFAASNDAGAQHPVNVIETLVPAVAREIGRRWEEDTLSFSQVTVASTRLQELVRNSASAYVNRQVGMRNRLTTKALFVVPETENHSIGGIVAARRAQREGLIVDLSIAQSDEEVVAQALNTETSCIGISIASRRQIQPVGDLIKRLHDSLPDCVVVVGGNVLNICDDVRKACEADQVTNDIQAAVEFFAEHSSQLLQKQQVL